MACIHSTTRLVLTALTSAALGFAASEALAALRGRRLVGAGGLPEALAHDPPREDKPLFADVPAEAQYHPSQIVTVTAERPQEAPVTRPLRSPSYCDAVRACLGKVG